jgi:serine phosphatase RsbU (regulator of sigma subunit)
MVKEKILLVDDDTMVLASLKRQLRGQYQIETALSGEEGLKMIEQNGPYAVIVSDFLMPGLNGIEFLSRVKALHPDTMRMMLTGSADMDTAIKAVNEGSIFKFHPKPCPADTLRAAVQSAIAEYLKATAAKKQLGHVKRSLVQASVIQQKLMPRSDPQVEGFDIAGKSISCDETSGDYYDFIYPAEWQRQKIGIAVADVIGHGISAALLMASVRAFLRERVLNNGSGAEIVCDVNQHLARDIEELNLFITMYYSEIDITAKCFRWVHAGHEPALLYDCPGDFFISLGGEGLPLGVMHQWAYKESEMVIRSGQIIVIGTDGIKETRNSQKEYFGNDRLMAIIRANASKPAKEILKEVFSALDSFRYPAERKDDETLVVVKVL